MRVASGPFRAAPEKYGWAMPTVDNADLIEQLRNVSETIGERTMNLLREALESRSGVRPPEEKVLAQARRAVDKAINLLEGSSVRDD